MATKLQYYSELAEQTLNDLTSRRGNWLRFLETSAWLYKYPFHDSLMIFAQRPDATACAELEFWNEKFSRWVRRGSRGIALIDDSGNYPRIKYVFDVSDTESVRNRAKPVKLWEMRKEHKQAVLQELSRNYEDINLNDSLTKTFHNIAKQLATEYYDDNRRDILFRSENSILEPAVSYDGSGIPLEEIDDTFLNSTFERILANSITYSVMVRCGLDPAEYFAEDDFDDAVDFNTPDMTNALGVAANELSKQVLRDIEITVRKYEKAHAAERSENNHEQSNNLHTGRGLPTPEHQAERTAERTDGANPRQVRTNEEGVSERLQADNVQPITSDRETIPPSAGSGRSSDSEDGTNDESVDGEDRITRQIEQSDRVDGDDERIESTGGGNGAERTDIRIENQTEEQTGAETKSAPFSMAETLSQAWNSNIEDIIKSSPITKDEVDIILRDGGNLDAHYLFHAPYSNRSSLRIAARFAKGLGDADFLKREYLSGLYGHRYTESGKGFEFSNHNVCAWYSESGITLAVGVTARNNIHAVTISWEQAAARINELIHEGRYVSRESFNDAMENEQRELASRLWDFYRDDLHEMPDEWRAEKGGAPADEEIIKGLLADEDGRQEILIRLEGDVMNYDYEEHERSYHNHELLLDDMQKFMNPPIVQPNDNFIVAKDFKFFITNDEIDSFLMRGSSTSEGKFRVFSYFLGDNSEKEKIDFIKNEYGHGGGTLSVINGWSNSEPGKGLRLQRGDLSNPDAEVNLNWNAVVRRIQLLINEGRYMTRAELDRIPNYEKIMLVRVVNNFYHGLPEEYERPFHKEMNFHYPHEAEWEAVRDFLNDSERIDDTLSKMQYIFENTSTEDRYYDTRKKGYETLKSFRNGTYTLFPGVENLPAPETVSTKLMQTPIISGRGKATDTKEIKDNTTETEQLSLFNVEFPQLPSVEEQQLTIAQNRQQDEQETDIQATEDISVGDDKDGFLLNISDNDKARIAEQFNNNPRSREAVSLIKEVYGDIPIPQAIKRISELISEGRFAIAAPKPELHLKPAYDFYELSGDEAKIVADVLDLTMISRNGEPMVGFPSQALQNYLKRLTEAGYAVHVPETIKETEQTTELDFDTVANTVLARVMADAEFVETLKTAESRSSLRSMCSKIVERIIGEHQTDEPNVFSRFNSDDDFNEDINSYVLRQSWLNKPKQEVGAEIPVAEPATEQTETAATAALAPSNSPPPVFVVDWQQAQHDFNLNLYKDRDIIAYDKDGVQHALGRSGNVTYVTSTGAFWGSNEVPADIYEQINDYKDGKLTAEQVRENYLKILAEFKVQKEKVETGIKVPTAIDSPEQQSFDEPKRPQHAKPVIKGHNFRITDDHLGEGGAKTKFRSNINALKTLVNIESENRAATPEEQETLSRYVGWGGIQQAFDPDNKDWEKEYHELKDLLAPDEWESARATVLNAHYTSPLVIKAIYETIERLGFKNERSASRGYNILEPSLGVGNFFGLLPDSMKSSKLYGTELDNVTARIAKQLYPNAEIQNMPYEDTQYSDAFFDIAIGNVPFGGFGVIDNRYKTNFNIHDYFFQKTLDKVRPGGIIAFITSKGTLDKKNPEARKYMAQRAELLGAVRLPNNAFLKNAGTEATTDIIFLQKRDRPIDIGALHLSDDKRDWVSLGLTDDKLPINRYFLDNPEMLLGRMTNGSGSRMYGDSKSTTCEPIEGADLGEQLKTALSYVKGEYTLDEIDDMDGIDNNSIPADPNVKNFSYTDVDGKVYFRENSLMYPVDLPVTTLERIKGMIHLRDCVHKLINLQLDEYVTDETIKEQQAILNLLYDSFIAEFGLISSSANNRAFNADSAYYLLSSLEILDENGNLERKADMFTKRTIKPKIIITHVDTASEALAVSIGEKACVDIEYMSELTGFSPEQLINLTFPIFKTIKNPHK